MCKLQTCSRSYLVKTTARVDGRRLDNLINNVRKWRQKVRARQLRIKKDFRAEKALVAHVHLIGLGNDSEV